MDRRYRRTIKPRARRRRVSPPALLSLGGIGLVVAVGLVSFLAVTFPADRSGTTTNGLSGPAPASSSGTRPSTTAPASTSPAAPASTTTSSLPRTRDAAYRDPGTGSEPAAPPENTVITSTVSAPPPTEPASTTPTPTPTVTIIFPVPVGGGGHDGGGGHGHR
jgi:hypothetical protein